MNDERIKADSAFPMELLALVAALRILDRIPGCKKILTDCQSAVKLLGTPAKLVKWSKKANVALLKAAIKVGRGHLDKIEHVDSHPEERLHRSRWNRNDEGNFIADRIAI
jgi:ribonuclease HI